MKEICIERSTHRIVQFNKYPLPALYLTEATFHEIKIRFPIPGRYSERIQFVITIVHVQTDN